MWKEIEQTKREEYDEYTAYSMRGWYYGVKWAAKKIKKGELTPEDIEWLHPEYYKEPKEWMSEEEWKKQDVWGDVI